MPKKSATIPRNRAELTQPSKPAQFLIVGIGASAGGLEAFLELLRHLPADTGMGFVLVQHLDPHHESALTHLLARATTMPVREVTQDLRVEPNSVYVIAPNVQMAIEGGVLKLTPRGKARGATRSIDFFFEALALDQGERAVGVVLSGTASDGTAGLAAIKAEGGVTFAQDESAKFDSMPRSAIAAGCVDAVLAPGALALELARIAKHPLVLRAAGVDLPAQDVAAPAMHAEAEREADQREGPDAPLAPGGHGTPRTGARRSKQEAAASASTSGDAAFKAILLILRNHCGVDFSLYKSPTIQRRVTRRVVLNRYAMLAEYAVFLKGNAKERDALYSDVLISVTSFFRNPDAFDRLKRNVFPKLLAKRERDEPVRVWVLGCSTGQEAYSLAMTFAECAADDLPAVKLQIFATDLNEALLDKARHGLYAKSLAQDISPERLRRFFVEEDGGWRVTKLLREQVVFARQNVMSDPPFSRMDLISCRNLLIYLEPELQKKIFPAFHYALKPGGFLFLGASESIGTFTDLFAPADKKQKIFSKKAVPTPSFRLPFPSAAPTPPAPGQRAKWISPRAQALPDVRSEYTAQREADRVSVSQFAPPGVLIDATGQVLQFRGATGAYLAPPPGKASFDVLKMARDGLMLPLRAALNQAKREQKPARRDGLRVGQNGGTRAVNLQVIPLRNLKELCFLILFEEAAASSSARAPVRALPPAASKRQIADRTTALERELAETREYLQSIQEQNESAQEELQASSEEVQSANEELQSINEELETSKEELESTNEELTTLNDEMVNRNAELNRVTADLTQIQISMQTAILVLARDLTIRRFTPPAEKIFNLLATDIGRGIGGIRHNLEVPDLEPLLAEVIATVSLREREVRDKDGRWYALRARPYLTLDNKVDGVVVVMIDIDALKRIELEVVGARDYAEGVLRTIPVPFLVLSAELRVNTASDRFFEHFKVTPQTTEGRLVYEIGNGQWNIPELRELLEKIIPEKKVFNGYEVIHEFAQIGQRTMLLNARRVESVPERILLSIEDVTAIKQANATRLRLAAIVESSEDSIIGIDLNGIITSWNQGARRLFGYTEAEAVGQSITLIIPSNLRDQAIEMMGRIRRGEAPPTFDTVRRRKDGTSLDVSQTISPLVDAHGTIVGASGISRDISERRRAERILRDNEERIRLATEATAVGIWEWHIETGRVRWDAAMFRIYGIAPTPDGFVQYEDWRGCVLPEELPEQERLVAQTVRECGSGRREFRIRRRDDGECRHIEAVETARMNAEGRVGWLLGTNLDVTEHKRMAAALQDAVRRKDEFLATLSHELRNPLAPIRNGLHLLRTAGKDSAIAAKAQTLMERQLKHLIRLVDDLLDVSRITSGKVELRIERVLLEAAVSSAVETCRPLIEEMGHELSVTLSPQPLIVHGDLTRLAQVFTNLLNNAAKYSNRGSRIALQVERDAGDVLVIVRDTGIGIAADQIPHIFTMFTQIVQTNERSQGGLGIGLSLAKQLVEMHGGTIQARSAGLGAGAEFVVRLPVVMETAEPSRPLLDEPSPPAESSLRILVADDNRDSADSLSVALSLMGNDVRTAYDGEAAVKMAAAFRPQVVLLDIGMPKLNGYDTCRRIRDMTGGEDMVLIAVTGWGADEARRRSNDAGFNQHLVKPVDPGALMQLLNRLSLAGPGETGRQ